MLLDAVFAVDDTPQVETYRDRVRITVPTGGHAIRVAISQNEALMLAERLRRAVGELLDAQERRVCEYRARESDGHHTAIP